jgi:hypothetical protein
MGKVVLLLISILMISCAQTKVHFTRKPKYTIHSTKDYCGFAMMDNDCFGNWELRDLKNATKLKVLVSVESFKTQVNNEVTTSPNWVIGVDEHLDTIIVIDLYPQLIVNVDDTLFISPSHWTESEKSHNQIARILFYDSRTRRLLCIVKYSYYASFAASKL